MFCFTTRCGLVVGFSDRIMALDDEYIAMIGMGVLILLLMIVITVLICTVGTRRRTKS